jgi:O-antigen/teichoic acid export membrane protein
VGSVLPLLTLPILTRILTKEEYGLWALATVYAVFVSGLANFGMTVAYERNFFENRDPAGAAKLLYSTVGFVLCTTLVCGLLTWVFREPIAGHLLGSVRHANFLFLAFCATGLASLKLYFLIYFKNTESAKSYVWYTVDENVLATVFTLMLVAYLRVGVVGLVVGPLVASALVLCLLTFRFVRTLPVSFSGRLLLDSLRISYPLTPRIFLGVLGNQADKYLIGLLGTLGGVGLYTIGQRVSNLVFTYMTALENVFAPQVYKRMFDQGDQGGASVGRYLTPFAYGSIAVALIISLFSEEAIRLVAPTSYQGAVPIVSILAIYYGVMFFGKQPQLIFAKKTHVTSALTIVTITMNVGINLVFIRAWGSVGAAMGTTLAGVLSVSLYLAFGQRYYRIDYEWKKLLAIYGLLALGAGAASVLWQEGAPYGIRLALKIGFLGAYIVLGLVLGFISRSTLGSIAAAFGVGQARGEVPTGSRLQEAKPGEAI